MVIMVYIVNAVRLVMLLAVCNVYIFVLLLCPHMGATVSSATARWPAHCTQSRPSAAVTRSSARQSASAPCETRGAAPSSHRCSDTSDSEAGPAGGGAVKSSRLRDLKYCATLGCEETLPCRTGADFVLSSSLFLFRAGVVSFSV